MKSRFGLAWRITVFFAGVALFLMAVLSVANATFLKKRMQNSLVDTMRAVAESNAQSIKLLVTRMDALYESMTDPNNIYLDSLLVQTGNQVMDVKEHRELETQLQRDTRISLGSMLNAYTVYLFVSDSTALYFREYLPNVHKEDMLYAQAGGRVRVAKASDFRTDPWYAETMAREGGAHWFEMENSICVARALTTKRVEEDTVRSYDMGILFISFEKDWFSRHIISERLTQNTRAAIYDAEGQEIWTNEAEISGDVLEMNEDIADGLSMSVLIPWKDIDAMSYSSVRVVFLLLAGCAVVGAALVTLVSISISKPIRRLSDFMCQRTGEAIPQKMMPARKDEIGVLYNSYNELIQTIHQKEEERKKTEMERLQAQINPHFLYNTLDSMCFLAMTSGKPDIAQVLSSLAKIYRYNIKNADGEVLLEQEREILEMYVGIYRRRSVSEIDFHVDCPPEAACAVIPKMILQPLVENAILYGANAAGCHVAVRCLVENECLRIIVSDQGGQADVDAMNGYLAGKNSLHCQSTGLGIMSVHQRVFMRYGDGYGLRYERGNAGETLAIITMPYRLQKKEG